MIQEEEAMDQEWVELIKEARNLGITIAEIKLFLMQASACCVVAIPLVKALQFSLIQVVS